jgi:hypothetical protein
MRKEIWTTRPRGEGKKEFWLRIGTAFENRDGSWTLIFDALPIDGRAILRDEETREQREERFRGRDNSRREERRSDIPF